MSVCQKIAALSLQQHDKTHCMNETSWWESVQIPMQSKLCVCQDSLSARCRAPHGIAEEVVVAQRDVPILATCHARSFHSLILRQHVVGEAAAASTGLAGRASLWC